MNWTVVVANVGVAAGGSSATTTRCVIDRVAGASNRPPLLVPCHAWMTGWRDELTKVLGPTIPTSPPHVGRGLSGQTSSRTPVISSFTPTLSEGDCPPAEYGHLPHHCPNSCGSRRMRTQDLAEIAAPYGKQPSAAIAPTTEGTWQRAHHSAASRTQVEPTQRCRGEESVAKI